MMQTHGAASAQAQLIGFSRWAGQRERRHDAFGIARVVAQEIHRLAHFGHASSQVLRASFTSSAQNPACAASSASAARAQDPARCATGVAPPTNTRGANGASLVGESRRVGSPTTRMERAD